jgi:hypothetical protein
MTENKAVLALRDAESSQGRSTDPKRRLSRIFPDSSSLK